MRRDGQWSEAEAVEEDGVRQRRRFSRLVYDYIPWPSMALSASKDIKNNSPDQIMMVKCFHDYLTVEESSTFILRSRTKDLKNATVGNPVLHVLRSP